MKRSISTLRHESASKLEQIDKLSEPAGLVRTLRKSTIGEAKLRSPQGPAAAAKDITAAPVPRVGANGAGLLQIQSWRDRKTVSPWLWHGFSTRIGGVSRAYAAEGAPGELNLGFTADDNSDNVAQNRRLLAAAVSGDQDTPMIALHQFHSNLVIIVGPGEADPQRPVKADGAITAVPGLLIAIQTADCIPVLVVDRKLRVVAGFHAGWRGTIKRIVELGVGRMGLEFGSQPKDLMAAIGPGVGPCCYAVGEEVRSEFESQFIYARELFRDVVDADPVRGKYPQLSLKQRAPGYSPTGPALHLDLTEANRRQLLDAGLKQSAISLTGGCTSCHTDLFFSHRASQGHAGRMMSVIGIRG